jgi:hypothetical protein
MSSVTQPLVQVKELEESFRPSILYQLQLKYGPMIYFGKADDGANRGVNWNGNFYPAAVSSQSIGGIGGQSSIGLDIVGSVSVALADADALWWYYEQQYGFQGATVFAYFVFFDPYTNQFSSSSKRIFVGICDPASRSDQNTTISAKAKNALDKKFLPPMPIQRTCPHWFPANAAQRAEAANNPFSFYFGCGYSPDQGGGVGNYQSGTTPYTFCTYEPKACQDRGMWDTDHLARVTRRYAGVQWDPPATYKGRQYTSGKQVQGVNNANPGKWTQFVPLTFGTAWVSAIAANIVGDPNSTRGEFMINSAWLNSGSNDWVGTGIKTVVVNGLLIPHASQTKDVLFRWYQSTDGGRTGARTQGVIYEGKGDCYGSIATILPVVYQQVANSNSVPNVQVLVGSRVLPVWTSQSSYSLQRTSTMAWCLLEVLRLLLPDIYGLIDMPSVIAYALVCNQAVSYTNLYLQPAAHQRFGCSLVLTQKQPGNQVVEALKIAGRVLLVPNADGTNIKFLCKQTLCEQQPNPVSGSNRNTPIASFRATDNPAGSPTGVGYSAYHFDESTCVKGSIRILQDGIANTPITITAEINDEDNDFIQDRITVGDPVAYDRTLQEVETVLPVMGLPNYDQAYRAITCYQGERFRGNRRNDSGGTLRIEFTSTFRAVHLNQGDIVTFANTQLLISFQTFRVEAINYTDEYRQTQLTLRWHEDAWYTDGYGQLASPYTATYFGYWNNNRPPYPWQAKQETAVLCDAFYPGFNPHSTYSLDVGADQLADGTVIPELLIQGKTPVNKPVNSLAPRLSRQGNALISGGFIPDGTTCYTYIGAIDANGFEGPPNPLACVTFLPGFTNNNSFTFQVLAWPPGTVSFRLYNGPSPQQAGLIYEGPGTPSSISVSTVSSSNQQPVDVVFDHFILRTKRITGPGYLLLGPGFSQTSLLSNVVGFSTINFNYGVKFATGQYYTPANNELLGRVLIAVHETGGGTVPFLHLRIAGNTGYALTIDESAGNVNLASLQLGEIWFIVTHRIASLDFPNYVHFADNSLGTDTTPHVGSLVRVIGGTGAGQELRTITTGTSFGGVYVDQSFSPALALDSVVIIEESTWRTETRQPSVANANPGAQTETRTTFDNLSTQFWLTQVSSADKNGVEPFEQSLPFRLFYWPGQQPGQSFYQGINQLPNADLGLAGGAGEVAAGYSVIKNTQNAYQVTLEPSVIYTGKNSFHFHLEGQGSGWTLQPQIPFDAVISTTQPMPLPQRKARYFIKTACQCWSSVASLPTEVEIVLEYRITMRYDDGTFDTSPVTGAGWFGDQGNPLNQWIDIFTAFTTRADSTVQEMHLSVTAYINSKTLPNPVQVYPAGQRMDVFVSGLSLVRTIDLGKEVFGNDLSGIVGQGSIIPSQVVPVTIADNSNNGSGSCHILLTWPSTPIQLSNQAFITVPAGSFEWSGLGVATYWFYFRISASLEKTGFAVGTMLLASGAPPTAPPMSPSESIATSTYFDGYFPQPPMTVTTPSNAGTGGGGGGGADTCPEANEYVYEQTKGVVRIGDVQVGDWLRGKDWETGLAVYRRVRSKKTESCSTWRMVGSKRVSPNHPVSFPDKKQWQHPWRIGTMEIFDGTAVRLELDVPTTSHDEASYCLVNEETGEDELVMHNPYINPC